MSHMNFDYVPLTFINDQEEIKKQIRNTLILIHLFEKYNEPVKLEKLIEGTQYGYNASALKTGKNKFLRISDIHESKVNWETVPYCNCDDENTYLLKKDDILIARTGGTTGKSFKIDNPPAHSIFAGYLIRIRAKEEVNPDYIYLFLKSYVYWSQIVNLNERNFRPKANAKNLNSLILPNCPPEIQNDAIKISNGEFVNGYEDLYSAVEKTLAEYDKIQELEQLFAEQLTQLENLNQAILQEAVQGKLVPQDLNDEPATELLKRIKEENNKEDNGKKQKSLPPIKPEEIPFEIPESWVWCRLGEIVDLFYGEGLTKAQRINNGEYPVYGSNGIVGYHNKYLTDKRAIIVGRKGSAGALNVCQTPSWTTDVAYYIEEVAIMDFDFTYYLLKSLRLEEFAKGVKPGINRNEIYNNPIPLPPLSEQKRIVEEIEKQLTKTKQLKEYITANQEATEQLLKALLQEAFEGEK